MSEPITLEWLKVAGFCEPTRSAISGYSYWFKYVCGYHALAVRFEKRNGKWQWQLEEHRDHMNWDDKYLSLPGSCQPQTIGHAEILIRVMSGEPAIKNHGAASDRVSSHGGVTEP